MEVLPGGGGYTGPPVPAPPPPPGAGTGATPGQNPPDNGPPDPWLPKFTQPPGSTWYINPQGKWVPPAQVQTAPAYAPNYGAIIRSDPGYLAAQNAAKAAEATAAAQRREQIRNDYISYGGDLAGWKDSFGDIDQATRDLAAKNQFSTLAQLARGLSTNARQMRQQLAARGMLQSGDLAFGQDQLNTGNAQDRYNAGVSLGTAFGGAVNNYTGVLDQNRTNIVNATQTAYGNAVQNPANRPHDAQFAGYDAGESAKAGQPIYVDPATGNKYTLTGQAYAG